MPAWSPIGNRLAFLSDRSGTVDLWMSGPDQHVPLRLYQVPGTDFTQPAWSPDGERLALGSSLGIHVMDVTSGAVRHVMASQPLNVLITPAGDIVYTSDDGAGPGVRRLLEDGAERMITPVGEHELLRRVDDEGAVVTPVESPHLLLYRPFEGPEIEQIIRDDIPADAGASLKWSFDGEDFYYIVDGPKTAIRHFDPSRTDAIDVYRAEDGMIRGLSALPGSPYLVFAILRNNGIDLMLVEPLSDLPQ